LSPLNRIRKPRSSFSFDKTGRLAPCYYWHLVLRLGDWACQSQVRPVALAAWSGGIRFPGSAPAPLRGRELHQGGAVPGRRSARPERRTPPCYRAFVTGPRPPASTGCAPGSPWPLTPPCVPSGRCSHDWGCAWNPPSFVWVCPCQFGRGRSGLLTSPLVILHQPVPAPEWPRALPPGWAPLHPTDPPAHPREGMHSREGG
jgi:hypothetical protein